MYTLIVQNNGYCLKWKRWKQREPAGYFLNVFVLCLTERSKGYVSYIYTHRKYKSITVYIKNKTGGGD